MRINNIDTLTVVMKFLEGMKNNDMVDFRVVNNKNGTHDLEIKIYDEVKTK